MKILFIYLFLSLGGVESVLKNRYEGLSRRGIRTDFLFLEDHGGASSFEMLTDSKTYITNDRAGIEKIIAEGTYDLVSVIDTPRVHGIMREVVKKTKVVMEVHTPFPPFREYIRKDIVEDACAVVVPTAAFGTIVDSEMKKPHPPLTVIPNPLNEGFLGEAGIVPEHPRIPIAMVGRIEDIKDWRESVRIVELVLRKRRDIDFFMVGRTIEDSPADIYREFSKRKMMGHLRWLPFIRYDRMPAFYSFIARNNGVYLTSSKGESFGMTLIESMSCRLPVVAYNLPVFREVLEGGSLGMLYRTTEEAAEQVLSLIRDRDTREKMTANAYRAVIEKYTSAAFAEKWERHVLKR